MVRTIMFLAALALAGCGGREPTTPNQQLQPAPLTAVTWAVSGNDCNCPGASVRHDYWSTGTPGSGTHVVFCTWACGAYAPTIMTDVPVGDHSIVTLEMGYMRSGGWQLLSEDVQHQGRCLP